LNQKKYQPVAESFGLSLEASLFTKIKIGFVSVFGDLFAESVINVFKKATIAYVTKLEKLEEIAGNKNKNFFRYVVLQEKLQAQALTLLGEDKYQQAVFILNDFVAKYDT
jgi:hypothetical protein